MRVDVALLFSDTTKLDLLSEIFVLFNRERTLGKCSLPFGHCTVGPHFVDFFKADFGGVSNAGVVHQIVLCSVPRFSLVDAGNTLRLLAPDLGLFLSALFILRLIRKLLRPTPQLNQNCIAPSDPEVCTWPISTASFVQFTVHRS